MRRLLIVTYYWPPLGGPGSIRPVKFAKYLPKFGIRPIVCTRKDISYHSFDRELNKEIENLEVIRTESLDPARILYLLGMKTYRPRMWHTPIKKAINFPDNKLAWLPFAYAAGIKTSFDCILVTAPPFSSFITGYYLAKKANKPLILDFRDAWLEFPFLRYQGKAQRHFVSLWERKITKSASVIIVVDENIKKILSEKYPWLTNKIHVIPNGYDPSDFATAEKPSVFTISYLGTIREERDPENVLKAIDELITKNLLGEKDIRVKFIGHIEKHYLDKIKKYKFAETLGHLPYGQAIKEFCSSHVALLVTTGSEYFFPSRQNEYLASGMPIIVCGKSKGIHVLESAFKKGYPGWIFDFEDIKAIQAKIFVLYHDFKKRKIPSGETLYKEYTRENLASKLADLINLTT